MNPENFTVFVDVDDTLIRTSGEKRIPIPRVVARVRELHDLGATLYCWSSGGSEYAQHCAAELGIAECFVAFLPKPHVIVDDQAPAEWKYCRVIRPLDIDSLSVDPERAG
jgi:predicted HAD superfamily phosphohydrolase YqeG